MPLFLQVLNVKWDINANKNEMPYPPRVMAEKVGDLLERI
ncbi:Hypothetical Protein U712_02565 [Bacillus subtilis PY79]|nr:Hypothetical Protein U712_02565 [Bacillus subtilis PY79]AKN12594.1 hypothetical protein ABU16_1518 [Bacillus subtilis]EHA29113.1 hypothetical protein BSSC8_38220 [Bacillus subtilis subsp. subtilis str. SC-8]KZD82819.1 hypothetical protein B4417_1562 [Bacillus subtilis]RPK08481.1 hypothetical protein EH5_03876 [Bacillus subtilis]